MSPNDLGRDCSLQGGKQAVEKHSTLSVFLRTATTGTWSAELGGWPGWHSIGLHHLRLHVTDILERQDSGFILKLPRHGV